MGRDYSPSHKSSSRNRSPRRDDRRRSPQPSTSRHSRERERRHSRERKSHKKSKRSRHDRRRNSSSSSDSYSSPPARKNNSLNNSNHIRPLPPPSSITPSIPFYPAMPFPPNATFPPAPYQFMQPNFGIPPPMPMAFNNPYSQSFLPPPPPPPEELFEPPPPPPPELPPSTTTNGTDNRMCKFDSTAISTAMRAKPVIFNQRRLPVLPKRWGTMSMDAYSIIVQVGEGTYGHVYKAKRKDSTSKKICLLINPILAELVALKKVRLENEREGFPITAVREIKLLRRLDHPNIVKLIDVVTETSCLGSRREFGAFFLVFEYVDHDLNGLLESGMVEFTQDQIASLFKQLLLALQHCHSKDLLHRDLKCANILINNRGELKLGDFGLARIYLKNSDRLYTNRVITLWYRPPELLLGEEKYGPAIDIWSAGCILGELFTKKPIFQGHNEQQQLDLIAQFCGTPTTEVWADVINLPLYVNMRFRNYYPRSLRSKFSFFPATALDLFDMLLALDPKKRPSATKALEHSWLRKIEPSRIPPPDLPKNQDCHERWAKLQRNEQQRSRRSNSLNVNNQSRDSAVAF